MWWVVGIGFIFGGVIGNVLDCFFVFFVFGCGYVIDFFVYLDFFIGNLVDVVLGVGVVVLVVGLFWCCCGLEDDVVMFFVLML